MNKKLNVAEFKNGNYSASQLTSFLKNYGDGSMKQGMVNLVEDACEVKLKKIRIEEKLKGTAIVLLIGGAVQTGIFLYKKFNKSHSKKNKLVHN